MCTEPIENDYYDTDLPATDYHTVGDKSPYHYSTKGLKPVPYMPIN